MKSLLPVLIAASTLSPLPAFAADPTAAAAPALAAEQQVLALDRAWADAEVRRDAAALRQILDDRFIATFGAGKPLDKEAFISAIVDEEVDPTASQELSDRTVLVDRDTAVVVETDTVRGTADGQAYTAVYRLTTTYVRHGDRWVALAEHLVRAPPAR